MTKESVGPEFVFLRADAKRVGLLALRFWDTFSFFNIAHGDPGFPPFMLKGICLEMSEYMTMRILLDGYHSTMEEVKVRIKKAVEDLYEKNLV